MNNNISIDIESLKTIDKDNAMLIILHLLNASNSLVKYEPYLSYTLANIAKVVQKYSSVTDSDLSANEDIAEKIYSLAKPTPTVVTTEDL